MEFVNGFQMTSHIWNIIHSMVWNHQPVMFFNPLYSRSIYIPYIYIFHIYIFHIYIFHIYSIYIPYIFHIYIYIYIYSIYIPYIFHIYSIYIPYIELVVENCGLEVQKDQDLKWIESSRYPPTRTLIMDWAVPCRSRPRCPEMPRVPWGADKVAEPQNSWHLWLLIPKKWDEMGMKKKAATRAIANWTWKSLPLSGLLPTFCFLLVFYSLDSNLSCIMDIWCGYTPHYGHLILRSSCLSLPSPEFYTGQASACPVPEATRFSQPYWVSTCVVGTTRPPKTRLVVGGFLNTHFW